MIKHSSKILTLSTNFTPPKGGIAQVVNVYSTFFKPFNHIATKKGERKLQKLLIGAIALFRLLNYLLFKEIEIVHIHGASHSSFWRKRIFIRLSKIFGKKVLYHMHGAEFHLFYEKHKDTVKKTVLKCDGIVALSNYWKDFFEHTIGYTNVYILENVVEPPVFITPVRKKKCQFLFLGALGERKGIYDLLDVISSNKNKLCDHAVFHIGGNGEVERVKKIIKANGLENIVKFEGWVSGDKKAKLLSSSDVYLLPSYNEGLPISILEAMSYKLPILSTPVGGIPEVVEDGVNGLLVEPGDKKSLKRAILKMIEDHEFRKKAGEESYIKVQPHFPEQVKRKLNHIYGELLKQ